MKKDQAYLMSILNIVRSELDEGKFKRNKEFKNFPNGSCKATSVLVGKVMKEILGTDSKIELICASMKEQLESTRTHAWLEYENEYFIDLTADQFEPRIPKVIFENKKYSWFNNFDIQSKQSIDSSNIDLDLVELNLIEPINYFTELIER